MIRTKILFIAAIAFSLAGFSMQDGDPAITRVGHTHNISHCAPLKGVPNPAATYCNGNGGEYQIRKTAEGDVGVCLFSDNTECGGWAFRNGECAPGTCREWSVAQNICAVLVTVEVPDCGQAVEAEPACACDDACHANDNVPVVMPSKDACVCGAACACAVQCSCADDCTCENCNDCTGNASQVTTSQSAVTVGCEATHARCECGAACARANEGPCAVCSCANCNTITEPTCEDRCLCQAACSCATPPAPSVGGGCSE